MLATYIHLLAATMISVADIQRIKVILIGLDFAYISKREKRKKSLSIETTKGHRHKIHDLHFFFLFQNLHIFNEPLLILVSQQHACRFRNATLRMRTFEHPIRFPVKN